MPLNALRKDRSKHFSGRAARLASCLPVYSDRVNKSQFFNCNHLSVKNKSVKLPFELNKNIMLFVSTTKT